MVGDGDRKPPASMLFFPGALPASPPACCGIGSCSLGPLSGALPIVLPACPGLPVASSSAGCGSVSRWTSWGPRARTGLMRPADMAADDSMKEAERRVTWGTSSGSGPGRSCALAEADLAPTLQFSPQSLALGSTGAGCKHSQ